MKKFVLLLVFAVFSQLVSFASIESVIDGSYYGKNSSVAVMVADTNTSKTLYSRNQNIHALPASVLKVFTMKAAVDTLGYDYKFKTSLYKDKNQNLYLKLSGDPMLVANDVLYMLKKLPNDKYNTIYIDDTVLDDDTWGAGWSWDNNGEEGIEKFGAYNINYNTFFLDISEEEGTHCFYPAYPSYVDENAQCPRPAYPSYVDENTQCPRPAQPLDFDRSPVIINKIKFDSKIMYKLAPGQNPPDAVRAKWVNGKLYLSGSTFGKGELLIVPVDDIKENFLAIFKKLLKNQNIQYSEIAFATIPPKVELVAEVSHDLDTILNETLKDSNNFFAETIFKTAGGKYKNSQGTTKAAIEMFANYYSKNGVPYEEISIVDASGVSRKDMLTANWVVSALKFINQKEKDFIKYLPTPGEGTLGWRLLEYKNNLRAKTGSLDGISGIAGYITTKKGTPVAFCIFIQNYIGPSFFAKETENDIIKEIYENY